MKNIICIGGSSGSLDALRRIVRLLPADLPAAVFVVRHITPGAAGLLGEVLRYSTHVPVTEAIDGELFRNGHIYVAPPDRHLMLESNSLRLISGPKENWSRPAIDPLFRSAAQFHGRSTIGILLSGKLDDGAAGLWTLKRRGGMTIVQDPAEAESQAMPLSALAAVKVDVVAGAVEIGERLPEWCRTGVSQRRKLLPDRDLEIENSWLNGRADSAGLDEIGARARLICPECGGPLWRMKKGPLRYRCHVGHAESAQTLLTRQHDRIESAGWQLVRMLEEDNDLVAQTLAESSAGDIRRKLAQRKQANDSGLADIRQWMARMVASASPAQPKAAARPDESRATAP
jgi:two-component system chemotaxis response regulator CheB